MNASMKTRIEALAETTSDAYSWDRYGAKRWLACARMLYNRGLGQREIEAVLRSKWTRWAADSAKDPNRPNSADLARFMDAMPDWRGEARTLALHTFGTAEGGER